VQKRSKTTHCPPEKQMFSDNKNDFAKTQPRFSFVLLVKNRGKRADQLKL